MITRISPLSIIVALGALALGVLAGVGYQAMIASSAPTEPAQRISTTTVSLTSVGTSSAAARIETSGEVTAAAQARLTAEASGVIRRLPVELGEQVQRGQLIAAFANEEERASLEQAQASLESAQAQLARERASFTETKEGQEEDIDDAREQFLNTDLQAYLADPDISPADEFNLASPTITGTYTGSTTGSYRVTIYGTDVSSGYSFRYEGIESGRGMVSTRTPQPLGTKGLFIEFPENFARHQRLEWVIPIPNTRSPNFVKAKNQYEKASNEYTRDTSSQASIAVQEASVKKSRANVAAARARLTKTVVRAPFSGEITDVVVDVGDRVSPGSAVARLIDRSRLEIVTSVSSDNARRIDAGDTVTVAGAYRGQVSAVAPAVSNESGQVEIRIVIDEASAGLVVGEFVDVTINTGDTAGGAPSVPLSAVRTTGAGAQVFTIENGVARAHDVTTDRIEDTRIEIEGGLSGISEIITDVRDIRPGQPVAPARASEL